ncbi:tetratricopeptide repeat protein [Seleniivibrio sp.]|uniref:tetratricopeptide repeat protein n=1 Tax=Seleniivibrio sp. TaxID=2898801 RepID=UPI0025DC66F4|nr:tetratricopeptide repeat protein [Seleniivibrio sp.]MCD8553164.1 tetratricopeptide repeat protein [Seleniivibrio sp.]
MAYRSYIKKVPGFTFLGPTLIFAGMLTASDTGLTYALNPEMVLDEMSRNFAVFYFVSTAFFSFLLMHAGYLLYNGMVYSRYYASIVLYACLTAVLARVFLLGTEPAPWKIYLEAGCLAVALLYLGQKQFRVRFEYKRSILGVTVFFTWVMVMMSAGYAYMRLKDGYTVLPINRISFEESPYNVNLTPLPFSFGLRVPPNFHLSSIENEAGTLSVTFHNPDYGYIILSNFSAITPVFKRMRILGFHDELDFTRRFFNETVGLVPLYLRKAMTSMNVKEYDRVDVGGMSLLLEKSDGDNSIAHIFRGKELLGEVNILSISMNDTGLYNEIFSTLKSREPETDAQKLFEEGLKLQKDEHIEEAKRLFACASVINPEDAEYRYVLAETLALTGYVSSAKKQLETCIKLSPGHQRAQKLMEALNKLN